jgi:hypothetical protein
MSSQATVLVFICFLYVLILASFNKARKKYSGGKIGAVINLILVTVVLLFVSEYVDFLNPYVSGEITSTLRILFKTVGLSFLAYGGVRIAGK